jgi:hypothetical protein
MTSSTDKTQAVTDGTTAKNPKPERGLAALRRMEAQGLIRFVIDALFETQAVAFDIRDGIHPEPGQEVPAAQIGHQVLQALACLETADHYMRMLDGVIDTGEPLSEAPIPFR